MAWQEEFPSFEKSYHALLDNLNLNVQGDLDLHHRGRLLKLTISRGWKVLRVFSEENPEYNTQMEHSSHSIRKSLSLDQDLELNFSRQEVLKMDWEIREIVIPAFRDLYHFLRLQLEEDLPRRQAQSG